MNLYEKYGGFSQVNKIVMAFYDTLLDSEDIGPYFDEIDMGRIIDHQTKFIAMLLGGPASYTNEHLRRAHATLGITHSHFDELKTILRGTLIEHGMEDADATLVMDSIELRRSVIVTERKT